MRRRSSSINERYGIPSHVVLPKWLTARELRRIGTLYQSSPDVPIERIINRVMAEQLKAQDDNT